MKTIYSVDVHKRITDLKVQVPKLVKKYRPTDAEQAMYKALKLAQKAIDDCPSANYRWRDAKQKPPKRNGLFLIAFKTLKGDSRARTAWFVDGEWKDNCDVLFWGELPMPPVEVDHDTD